MKTKINENSKITLTIGQLKRLVKESLYGDSIAIRNRKLTYDGQLEFKKWAKTQGLSKKNGVDFYFDNIECVDGRDPHDQSTIRGVVCDGSLTWGEAARRLRKYFGVEELDKYGKDFDKSIKGCYEDLSDNERAKLCAEFINSLPGGIHEPTSTEKYVKWLKAKGYLIGISKNEFSHLEPADSRRARQLNLIKEDPVVEVYVDAIYKDDEISRPITRKKVEDFYSSLIKDAGYKWVTVTCTNPKGSGGGWPEITLRGYRSIIKKVLEDVWGMEDDADDYIDSCIE